MSEPTGAMPTVEMVDGHFYWVKHAYEKPELWTVARWEHGSFWDLNGREMTPRIISGPIPKPEG